MSTAKLGLGVVNKDKPKQVEKNEVIEWFSKTTKKNKQKIIPTDEAINLINASINDPSFDGFKFIDTMITYQSALENERVNLEDYVNAIRFTSYLEVYEGNATKAYIDAFKHRDFVKDRLNSDTNSIEYKQLASAATRYRKNPLVINILSQAEVPLYLMFQGYRYKAVSVLVKEMNEAKLSKDRINAADRLLVHLKPPENLKIELDVGVKKDEIVSECENLIASMVAKQKELLSVGEETSIVANAKHSYIDGEIVDE